MMTIKFFNYWKSTRELELNIGGRVWGFRIGTHQLALWRNYEPIFDFARPRVWV